VADINHDLAADGAKAISQIHNMERAGAYLFHHSLHVGILAALMGSWLEWDQDRREELTLAGLLHDVGKLSIDRALLDKTDPLTAEEFAYIKRHTEFGIAMLKNAGENRQEVLNGAAQHHERCDGSGYPQGLEGEQISVIGRIIAFLDIYDAMASDRAFVPRYSPFDAFEAMADDTLSGKLDPVYTVQFMRQTCRALIGTWVELSNGVRGRIVYIPESRIVAKPMIHTVHDEFIDLEVHTDLKVKAILTAAELDA
jgi:putative nucleotidyltransferase with HDIG domain